MSELISKADKDAASKEAIALRPVSEQIKNLVIRDSAGMVMADQLLARCSHARKSIEERIDKILKPLNSAVSEIRKFKKELLSPIDVAEDVIRLKMGNYREYERRELLGIEEQRRKDAEALRRQSEEVQRKVNEAKTAAAKRVLESRLEVAQTKLAALEAEPDPAPVVLAGSTTRVDKKVTVTDKLAFLLAIGAGKIPLDLVSVEQAELNRAYKEDPLAVKRWPGVEVIETTVIVRR